MPGRATLDRRTLLGAMAATDLTVGPGIAFGRQTEESITRMDATTSNGDVAIHYAVIGKGEPLVLLHGFTDSLESWAEMGYVAPLAAKRRLVLIDARGHGRSSKPHDPADYQDGKRAGDVAAVLDHLRIERTDLFGYSMGGWIALTFAQRFPERLGRLVVGGAHPFGQSMELYRQAVADDIDDWIAILERMGGPLPAALETRIRANDIEALRAAVAADRPDISAALAGLDRPALFYAGSEDPLRKEVARSADLIPRARFVESPGCNHLTALLRADLVLPHALALLAEDIGIKERA